MRILLIQYKMLGDVLTSTIIADQLKIIYPDAHLDYLIIAHASALVAHHPAIDNLIKVTKSDFEKMSFIISLSRKLKHNKYDLLIDAYGKNNSAVLSLLSRAKQRIGYKKWFSRLAYTEVVDKKTKDFVYTTGEALGSRMALTYPLSKNIEWELKPKIHLTQQEKEQGYLWLKEHKINPDKPLVMISVLGSSPNKSYNYDYMARVIDTIALNSTARILFNYIPSQLQEATAIYRACLPETQEKIAIEVFAPSIRDFLKILFHCNAIIGNEGGAINMGKALNIPSFTIFSPWIRKKVWNIGENETSNVSVHLQDYLPELYGSDLPAKKKSEALKLYKRFEPHYFKTKLEKFLTENL